MRFCDAYKTCLEKTESRKKEYEKMYAAIGQQDKFVRQAVKKDLEKLPSILARDYLDFLTEAVNGSDPFDEEEQETYSNEISLYMRYYDQLDGDAVSEIEWDELPDEARLQLVIN